MLNFYQVFYLYILRLLYNFSVYMINCIDSVLNVNPILHFLAKPIKWWHIISFIHCWIYWHFVKDFVSVFVRNICLQFLFFCKSELWFRYQHDASLIKKSWEVFFPALFTGKVFIRVLLFLSKYQIEFISKISEFRIFFFFLNFELNFFSR
jgi:hypothetical protein